jgi:hypothetical protein
MTSATSNPEKVEISSPLRPDWVTIIFMAVLHIGALFALLP